MPNITGTIAANMTAAWRHTNGFQGAFYGGTHTNGTATSGQSDWVMTYFNASRVSSVYGRSSTITPLSQQTTFLIRY